MPRPFRFAAPLALQAPDLTTLFDLAGEVERLGWDVALVPDHFPAPASDAEPAAGLGECWTTVTALGLRTERLRVGPGLACNPFRHPCLTAQLAACVDRLTGGRLELGLGVGWWVEEFRRTGIPFPKPSLRVQMLDEALEIVTRALAGERVRFEGVHYRVEDFVVAPRPAQRPRPPLHVGGGGDLLLATAARHADVVSILPAMRLGHVDPKALVTFTGEVFRERSELLRKRVEEAGRDPQAVEIGAFVFVTRLTGSSAETERVAGGMARRFGAAARTLRESPLVLIGTPEEMRAELERRREAWGLSYLCVLPEAADERRVFGEQVVGRLAGR